MATPDDDPLIAVALELLDGKELDWAEAARMLNDPEQQELIDDCVSLPDCRVIAARCRLEPTGQRLRPAS